MREPPPTVKATTLTIFSQILTRLSPTLSSKASRTTQVLRSILTSTLNGTKNYQLKRFSTPKTTLSKQISNPQLSKPLRRKEKMHLLTASRRQSEATVLKAIRSSPCTLKTKLQSNLRSLKINSQITKYHCKEVKIIIFKRLVSLWN